MTAAELSNLGVCGAASAYGFNTERGCPDVITAAEAIWLIAPSVVIAPDTNIDLAWVQARQVAGELVILQGINTFEENGSEDAVETLSDDTMILTNKAKYKFMASFTHGLYFQKALGSIEGFGNWRTIYVDDEGRMVLTEIANNGGFRGFRTGMIKRSKLSMPSNQEGLKQGLEFQLLERYELDDFYVMWNPEYLGFDPRFVEPITQVELSLVNAPADTDTTLTVKAVVRRGRKDAVAGAGFANFLNTVNGAASNPTAGDDSATAGTYVLTVPALASGENGVIQLGNGNDLVVTIDGSLYKSNALAYSVGA